MSEDSTQIEQEQQQTVETEDTAETQPTEAQSLWRQVAPDLAEHIQDLTPEAREEILLKRLAAKDEGKPAKGDEAKGDVADGRVQSRRPSAVEVPQFNVDELVDSAKNAIDTGDSEAWGRNVRKTFDSLTKLAILVHEANSELQAKMNEMYDEAIRPSRIRKVLPDVKGATDGDIASAERIYDSGEATTPKAALSLAVFRRQQDISASRKAGAERRSAGIAAGKTSAGPRVAGQPMGRIPRTPEEWEAVRAKEWEARHKK